MTNEELLKERDHWKDVAGREGVCMTCRGPYGAPEPYGCSDCFNTGYCGEHHNTVHDLEAKLAENEVLLRKAVETLEFYAYGGVTPRHRLRAQKTLAEIKGE